MILERFSKIIESIRMRIECLQNTFSVLSESFEKLKFDSNYFPILY